MRLEELRVPDLRSKQEHDEFLAAAFRREVRFPLGKAAMGVGFSNSTLVSEVMRLRLLGTLAVTAIGYNAHRREILAEASLEARIARYHAANRQKLLEEILAVRERMPHGILGGNVLAAASDFESMVDVMGNSKQVDILFVGAGLPRGLAKKMEQYPHMRYMPIVSSDRAANIMMKAAEGSTRPPDGFYMEDPTKAGGHLGAKDVADAENLQKFDLQKLHDEIRPVLPETTPLLVGGGLGTGQRLEHALAKGYDGGLIASLFLLTTDSGLPDHLITKYFLDSRFKVETVMTSPAGLPSRIVQAPKSPDDYREEIRDRCVSCIGHKRCRFYNAKFEEEESKPLDKRAYCIAHRLPMTQRGEEGGVLFTGNLDDLRGNSLYSRNGQPYVPSAEEALAFFASSLNQREQKTQRPTMAC